MIDNSNRTVKLFARIKIVPLLKFIETGSELRSNYSEVISPQDVAVYGALCALASFDRSELKVHLCLNYFSLHMDVYVNHSV